MAKMARPMGIKLSAVLTGTDPMSLADFKQAFADCNTVGAASFTAHPHPLKEDDQAAQREFADRFGAAAEAGRQGGREAGGPQLRPGAVPVGPDVPPRARPVAEVRPVLLGPGGAELRSEIFKYGKRIAHVHAKDEIPLDRKTDYGLGIIPMTYSPAGIGQINWGSVIAALYEVGYDGQIAIEPHSHYWCTDGYERGLVLAKRHLEQFMA